MAGVPQNRLSSYSTLSVRTAQGNNQTSTQVSTQTLLTSLHTAYSSGKPYALDAGTSLVVNTWATASVEGPDGALGGTIDTELVQKAWEHARRRAEDGCIILGSLHDSAPSLFAPVISSLPLSIPPVLFEAINALQPFLNCVTPRNAQTSRASAIAASFGLNTAGNITSATLKLASSGIDTQNGLINIPAESGCRAFDAFYYLLSSASTPAEREALGLRSPSNYTLLRRSETYGPPSYLPTADDAASAEVFRNALKAIGITGSRRRDLLATLQALLKLGETLGFLVDEEELDAACEDAAELLAVDSELLMRNCSSADRELLIAGLYEALVDWVLARANEAIAAEIINMKAAPLDVSPNLGVGNVTPTTSEDDADSVSITVLELPRELLAKAVSLKTIFDDSEGINAEMKLDGVPVTAAGHSVLNEVRSAIGACEPDVGIMTGHAGREREIERDRRNNILEKIGQELEPESFLKSVLYPVEGRDIGENQHSRFDMPITVGSSRNWFHLSIHPTDDAPSQLSPNVAAWSAGSVSRQLRSWRLPEWANRRNKQLDFTADFDFDEFCTRYARLGCRDGKDGIETFILERGWSNGEVVVGKERVWIREGAWWEAETMLEMLPDDLARSASIGGSAYNLQGQSGVYRSPFADDAGSVMESRDNLLQRNQSTHTFGARSQFGNGSLAPTQAQTMRSISGGDYGLGVKGDENEHEFDPEVGDGKIVTQAPITKGRRMWVAFVWAMTFWIPSFLLRYVGRMKRPDVRMAWREKVVLVTGIFLLNATIVFYIIVFGKLLCPNFDKAWTPKEVSFHQGTNDFYVSVRGQVYDISSFAKIDHSNIVSRPVSQSDMQPLAGMDVDPMFPIALTVSCPGLVSDPTLVLQINASNYNAAVLNGFSHYGSTDSPYHGSALTNPLWYQNTFLPRMKGYYKGELVREINIIESASINNGFSYFRLGSNVYDLTNYYYTQTAMQGYTGLQFLPTAFTEHVQQYVGQDISDWMDNWAKTNATAHAETLSCLNNQFYVGKTDFRQTARCQVNNYLLLAFAIVLCTVILTKFLAALQLGGKRKPAAQDKFVICQVPAYTEGEEHLRKGLDSLTALAYDNKRKLICVICDGMIVGGGNDRPTPKIVLDILGVDPKIDPPALPFKSVGAGSEQLNYGKVYSGLYEYEGNVVPYIVVVKVGKESEQNKSKPGNRGKRDSQIMLMSFLNRVHHRSPMSPLELEMFHQINNIIGVDPELYEYLFMVDADTMVKEDALNRLVASCANDAKIAGICGETTLENEERSWWTMIQVYEYFISHNLAKSFESLFGSVTCLPGCFCMYRLRTADKGKPLIISDKVINEYSTGDVDTLHKKNLLSLGEDRYLTTLMTKHFPHMSYKFVPGALALTAAPETWSILLSQRRRWINSTIHNLAELVWLKDLCGFCCFSMRFVVFIDLFGTLILPATTAYLGYLIYRIATGVGQFPLISVIMIAAVYGLQALIFIIKRQWQHVGWMIIYILAYPVYSFILPVYAFWKQDDFSWGNTRIVIGEKGDKKLLAVEDEGFDPRSIPLQKWDDYAAANNLPGRRGMPMPVGSEKAYGAYDDAYELDDMRSVYSAVKPASTILTGFKSHGPGGVYMPPRSPAPFAQRPDMIQRSSNYSDQNMMRYSDHPNNASQPHLMSLGNMSDAAFQQQYRNSPHPSLGGTRSPIQYQHQSTDNLLMGGGSAMSPNAMNRAGTRSPMPFSPSGPPSVILPDFQTGNNGQPADGTIVDMVRAVLEQVDLDNVTKKQVRALVEQRLQCQLTPTKREFLDHMIDVELANM